MKTMDDLYSELNSTSERLDEVFSELTEMEELDIIQKYIALISESEILVRDKKHKLAEIKEREMIDCNHFIVYGEKDKDDELPSYENVCCCIKCGLTNGRRYVKDGFPRIDRMKIILENTKYKGFVLSNKRVNVEEVKRRYVELRKTKSDKEIFNILSEELSSSKPIVNIYR